MSALECNLYGGPGVHPVVRCERRKNWGEASDFWGQAPTFNDQAGVVPCRIETCEVVVLRLKVVWMVVFA